MENGAHNNIFSSTTQSSSLRVVLQPDHDDNNNLPSSYNTWEPNISSTTYPSRFLWTNHNTTTHHFAAAQANTDHEARSSHTHAVLLPQPHRYNAYEPQSKQASLYTAGGISRLHSDPHLVCLRLGKRHCFEDDSAHEPTGFANMGKRGRSFYAAACEVAQPVAVAPRCQVEGCQVALVNAKDYHKRHKVCEKHSKAPKVIVLGLEQRFCQQCSRFHVVSEFDDSKRSCRRRLAGHNERRRKSSHDSNVKNPSQGGAFSLLSSKSNSWAAPSDFYPRSRAALQELIAENRAAFLVRQLIREGDWQVHQHWPLEDYSEGQPGSSSIVNHQQQQQQQMAPEQNDWDRFTNTGSPHVTLELDLMQAPSSAFGVLTDYQGKI